MAKLACGGYTLAKEAVLEIVDGGGFEAVIPTGIGNGIQTAKASVANLNLTDHLSNIKDYAVSTATDGYIRIKSVFE